MEFYILGRGPLEEAIRHRIDELDLNSRIKLLYTEEPQRYLSQSKIFLSLQIHNNYPSQSLLEAMACENAIVATDVGETWKLVDDSTGLRVAGKPEAVAQAVCTLLSDPGRLKNLGQNARQKVLKEHTVDRFIKYLNTLHGSGDIRHC